MIIQECITLAGHRDASGVPQPDPKKFPHGIKGLCDYIHSKGLLCGIYTDVGPKTCAGWEGSYNHEQVDAKTYAECERQSMRSEHPELASPAKRCLGALATVSRPWAPACGSLEPPRQDGENAQTMGKNREKMGEIRGLKRVKKEGTGGINWRGGTDATF